MSRKNKVRKPKPLSPEERAEGRAKETLETIRWFAPLVGRVLAMDDAGGHAPTIVGQNPDGSFIARNSWGPWPDEEAAEE
jgi:hypothetical protein